MPRPELSTLRYPNLWQGCVGAWCPSQSGATGYRLFDDSGNNNHGTLTNMDSGTDWVPSGGKLALDFDGTNDYVLGSFSGIDAFPFSLSIWVKYRYGVNDHQIDFAIGSDFNKYFGLGNFQNATNTKPYIYARNTVFNGVGASSNLSYETWNHVCGLFISDTKKDLYINGQYAVSLTDSVAFVKPTTFRLGNPLQLVFFTKSQHDDVRIYNRSLTPQEILLLYTGGRGAAYERSRGRKKAYVPGYRITAPSRIQTGSARTIDGTNTESLSRGLVGAWCPSRGASGYRLLDRSGNNNHGTLTNMDPGTDWVPSGGKLALDFDGVNDYISIQDRPQLRVTSAFTLACWFRRVGDGAMIENYYQTSIVSGIILAFNIDGSSSARIGGLIGRNSGATKGVDYETVAGGTTISDSLYHHAVFCFDFQTITVFLDGKIDGQVAWTQPAGFQATSNFRIAVNEYQSGVRNAFFNGQLDDIRIYNRALTPSEIRLLYTGGRGVGLLPEAKPKRARIVAWDNQDKISVPARVLTNTDSLKRGLVGHLSPSVSGPQGNRLMDLSGQNNHGTLQNMDYQTDYVPSAEKGGRMALDFDGVNDRVDIPGNYRPSLPMTFSAWVVRTADWHFAGNCLFWAKPSAAFNGNGFYIEPASGTFSNNTICVLDGAVASYLRLNQTGNTSFSLNTWTHFAVTVANSTTGQFYLNGIPVSTSVVGSLSITGTSDTKYIFSNSPGYGNYTPGQIDDVRIYNRALTPSEIRLLAQSRMPERATPQRTRTVFYSSGLVSYLRRRTYNSILGSGVLS